MAEDPPLTPCLNSEKALTGFFFALIFLFFLAFFANRGIVKGMFSGLLLPKEGLYA
jgi:hypothetical protein